MNLLSNAIKFTEQGYIKLRITGFTLEAKEDIELSPNHKNLKNEGYSAKGNSKTSSLKEEEEVIIK